MQTVFTTNLQQQLPTAEEVRGLVRFYIGDEIDRTILIPILINYAPIMLIGQRNYFLCIVVSPDAITLGFSTELTSRGLVTGKIPYSKFEDYVVGSSLCMNSKDEKLSAHVNLSVHDSEFITSIGLQTVGTLSIITSEYSYLKALIKSSSTSENTTDTILQYAIDSQSKFDAFVRYFTGRRGEGNLPKFAELRYVSHVLATNINMAKDGNLLQCFQECKGPARTNVYIEEVLLCKKDDFEVKVIPPNFHNPTVIPHAYNRDGDYYITGLGFIKDDFGPGSISAISNYTPTPNPYIMALMCNDKAFRHMYNNRRNIVYNNKYKATEYPDLGTVVEPAEDGNTSFAGFLSGSIFNARKG